jgi:hypothetical protein
MKTKHRIALVLAGALASGPTAAFEVDGGNLKMDDREVRLLIEDCMIGSVCTIFHFGKLQAEIKAATSKAYADGKKAAAAAGCKGGGPST